jgi:hypothetical protein
MDAPAETVSYSCTLEGDELGDRIQAWQRVVSRAIDHRVEDNRAVASYPKDKQLLEELLGLIEAESSCCSFLRFTLEVRTDRIVTGLRVPEEMPAPMKRLILDPMRDDRGRACKRLVTILTQCVEPDIEVCVRHPLPQLLDTMRQGMSAFSSRW